MTIRLAALGLALVLHGCAQFPTESVELSATIGRDLAATHDAHIALAGVLFSRMKADVNRFVDNVYAPHQINAVMIRQQELAQNDDPDQRRKSLLLALTASIQEGAAPELQRNALKGMELLVAKIRTDVESMRSELLDPVNAQEKAVLDSINRAYLQMHYANSIVTGHLSSVAKVHDTQAQLLAEFGVQRDLRKEVGSGIAKAANNISNLVETAQSAGAGLNSVDKNVQYLKQAIGELDTVLAQPKEEN